MKIIKKSQFLVTLMVLMSLSACSHVSKRNSKDSSDGAQGSTENYQPESVLLEKPKATTPLRVGEVELLNSRFDLPVRVNSAVEKWIAYFTGRGRAQFEKYLMRSEYFIPYIQPLLKQNDMPEDLVYLAMIESGFHTHARSSAKAVGAWQFMAATGRNYGLNVDWWSDERRDIREATLAAIRYLKDLHRMFGNWDLAAAAYNAGEAKVARAIRRYGTTDYWTIIRQSYLKPETRNYVPKMFAAAIVAKNRTLFGFLESYPEVVGGGEVLSSTGEVVKLNAEDEPEPLPDQVATLLGEEIAEVTVQGSAIEGEAETPENDLIAEDPPAKIVEWEPTAEERARGIKKVEAQTVQLPNVNRDGQLTRNDLVEVSLNGPVDLIKVAQAAGLSFKTIRQINPAILRWVTPPGQKKVTLWIPASRRDAFLQTYNHPAFAREVKFQRHKVRSGDSLRGIAKRYGVPLEAVFDLNGLKSDRQTVAVGKEILLPIPADHRRSLASLGIYDYPNTSKRRSKRFVRVSLKERKKARSNRATGI